MEDMRLESALHTRVQNSRKSTTTLLITGFEAFGDDPSGQHLNPSEHIATAVHGQQIGAWRVAGHVLPCEYGRSVRVLKTLLKEYDPQAILCLGQAGGRSAISIERIAINWDEAPLADNADILRSGQPILKTAPAAYFSRLPIHAMRDVLSQHGIPAEISSSAGQFVCNHVFFFLMHALQAKATTRNIPAGFIHVPYLPAQAFAGAPSMPLETMQQAIELAIKTLPTKSA